MGLVDGVIGGFTSLFNAGAERRQSERNIDRTYKYQKELAEYGYTKDIEMWNAANQYNSPAEQMQRLKDANLNPNMVYGSGTVAGNTSTQTPKYQQATPNMATKALQLPNLLEIISAYQDTKIKAVTTDNLQLQGDLLRAQEFHERNRGFIAGAEKDIKYGYTDQWRGTFAERLAKSQTQASEENVRRLGYDNDLRSIGMQPNDSLPVRILGRVLKKVDATTNWQKYFKYD